jgi:hypothetical protein
MRIAGGQRDGADRRIDHRADELAALVARVNGR